MRCLARLGAVGLKIVVVVLAVQLGGELPGLGVRQPAVFREDDLDVEPLGVGFCELRELPVQLLAVQVAKCRRILGPEGDAGLSGLLCVTNLHQVTPSSGARWLDQLVVFQLEIGEFAAGVRQLQLTVRLMA